MNILDQQEYVTLDAVVKKIKAVPAEKLYNQIGISHEDIDVSNAYYDMIIGYLLRHPEYFDSIKTITSEKSDRTSAHTIMNTTKSASITGQPRRMELIARSLLYNTIDLHDFVGTFIDYQTPLDIRDDKTEKIILFSYNNAHNVFYVIEYMGDDNREPLLRTILEAYTYFRQVDYDKLKADFHDRVHRRLNHNDRPRGCADVFKADVRAAVLIHANSRQRVEADENDTLIRLANMLKVGVYLLDEGESIPENKTGFMIQKRVR